MMNYLFFDVECSDGKHICSFGYVIINENFEILEKKDIVINPQWRFKLGRAGFDPRINLAYSEEIFKKQKPFSSFYDEIKGLLTRGNQILLGHSISADIQYLKIACERYNLPQLQIEVFDTQDFYYQLNKEYKSRSLGNIIKDLNLDILGLKEHKSCDDAELSMLVTKEICNKLDCSIDDLMKLCDKSKRNGIKKELSPKQKINKFARDLKNIAEKYPDRASWKAICLSDTIKENNSESRIALIKAIFNKGYNYTSKVSESDYFVTGNEYGERDLSCDHHIEDNNKDIRKITIKELSTILEIEINENGELIKKEVIDESNSIYMAIKKSLDKKGISYNEWIKSF